jgi:hypothetical protein
MELTGRPRPTVCTICVTGIVFALFINASHVAIHDSAQRPGGLYISWPPLVTTQGIAPRMTNAEVTLAIRRAPPPAQHFTVEHVHVHAIGQAVVGMVENRGIARNLRTPWKANCPCISALTAGIR